ncbi:uncharacterized protein LOC18431216 isoform X1 [Amborella trichopoda]|uniref:Telomere-associated protein Rif1 N-terminal domain-containing protein n=2 Tax=Amborella trichopoda TaxID=13333 RepID=W1P7X1_AMBTC|nr:uncharacterized protein LOC18431216 isoform X1 [Amborella trichopoda]XP_020521190.1 uncharacterized protein LOC18431216 isoform X1 [Amborella trichopoda]XP_020521191.1 uncharacterized protein LOC18431216 isoform X1 [Amborella trichopoda]XP_020521192.1 uncharacterized protein LOC18431216 isoform X1 [Amborella trichopoda]XP_020521193.1 uncharacterized protein LOC18431216 isoform X1 [Amborella trichopoda]ERN03085.1 hypothetical protein AMTR_s00003p00022210 [Amborella trichopoda]|eukprot:XP_020521189.1 uncharacterized protein LOC18431216 isoform X1 [Amborella trichopoda]
MNSKLLQLGPYDADNPLELSIRLAFSKIHPQLKPPFSLKISSPSEYVQLNQALAYAILTQPQLSKVHITHLHTIVTDGYRSFVSLLVKLVSESYRKLFESARAQLIWVFGKLIEVEALGVENLLVSLLRQIISGDFSHESLWLSMELLKVLNQNWGWVLRKQNSMTSALFTYLRLLADHYKFPNPNLVVLKMMEIGFCIRVLRESFHSCMGIGRDLIRLLQDLVLIPEFRDLWKDLISNPSAFNVPEFSDISQIYCLKTPNRYFLLRITPEMETQLRFMLSHVKWGNQIRYQEWFASKFLSKPNRESLICDIIRFICCAHHPPNEVIQSNVISRWAISGWLLKCCKKFHVEANAKLALFYDWFFFDEQFDNIMNIEPAMLLMLNSIHMHIDVTQTLLDFLFLVMDNYDVNRKEIIAQGIYTSLHALVRRGVVHSLEPLLSSSRISPMLREKLKNCYDKTSNGYGNALFNVAKGALGSPRKIASSFESLKTSAMEAGNVACHKTNGFSDGSIDCSNKIIDKPLHPFASAKTNNVDLGSLAQFSDFADPSVEIVDKPKGACASMKSIETDVGKLEKISDFAEPSIKIINKPADPCASAENTEIGACDALFNVAKGAFGTHKIASSFESLKMSTMEAGNVACHKKNGFSNGSIDRSNKIVDKPLHPFASAKTNNVDLGSLAHFSEFADPSVEIVDKPKGACASMKSLETDVGKLDKICDFAEPSIKIINKPADPCASAENKEMGAHSLHHINEVAEPSVKIIDQPADACASYENLEMGMDGSEHLNGFADTSITDTSIKIVEKPADPCPSVENEMMHIGQLENLASSLQEALKDSREKGLHLLEKALTCLATSSHAVVGGEALACQISDAFKSNGYQIFMPIAGPSNACEDDEIKSATALVIREYIITHHEIIQEWMFLWARNGLPVGSRLLSYISRLAHEAQNDPITAKDINSFLEDENQESVEPTPKRHKKIPVKEIDLENSLLLKWHICGYTSFMRSGRKGFASNGTTHTEADNSLASSLVESAFDAYRNFLETYCNKLLLRKLTITYPLLANPNRLPCNARRVDDPALTRSLLSDLKCCFGWKKRNPHIMFENIFSHLADLSTCKKPIVRLLLGISDHAELLNMEFEIGLKRFSVFGDNIEMICHLVKDSLYWEFSEQQKLWGLLVSELLVSTVPKAKLLQELCLAVLDLQLHVVAVRGLFMLLKSLSPSLDLIAAVMSLPHSYGKFAAAVLASWSVSHGSILLGNLEEWLSNTVSAGRSQSVTFINQAAVTGFLDFLDLERRDSLSFMAENVFDMRTHLLNLLDRLR